MPTEKPRISEAAFQKAVIEFARANGWTVAHFHDSRRQVAAGVFVGDRDAAGFPDLVATRNGRLVFAELKSDKGRLSVMQSHWLELLGLTEAEVHLWRPRDWPEVEAVLARSARVAPVALGVQDDH